MSFQRVVVKIIIEDIKDYMKEFPDDYIGEDNYRHFTESEINQFINKLMILFMIILILSVL